MDNYSICNLLESKSWKFAKTMSGIPHSYTLRENWGDDETFDLVVALIRKRGKQERWGRYNHHYLYLSGYKYWTMGAPIGETILINRAIDPAANTYDVIATSYDSLWQGKAYNDENKQVLRAANPVGKVLDIGCGTGLAVEWANIRPENYTGIDPSHGMLTKFMWKHPEYAARLRKCGFSDFWGGGFDSIIALFGTASYLENPERVMDMLNEGGRAFLMFYADGYEPQVYKKTRTEQPSFRLNPFNDSFKMGNYQVSVLEKR